MSGWLRALLVAVGLMVAGWALLALLVRRLPLACYVTWPPS